MKAIGAGEAEIRGTYQSVSAVAKIAVLLARFRLSAIVRDDANGSALRDVRVEVPEGDKAGRKISMRSDGHLR